MEYTCWTETGLNTALRDLTEFGAIYIRVDDERDDVKLQELTHFLDGRGVSWSVEKREGYYVVMEK